MGQDSSEIRREVEAAREQLGGDSRGVGVSRQRAQAGKGQRRREDQQRRLQGSFQGI